MSVPSARYPTLKARQVLQLLHRIGYTEQRRKGSHRVLTAPDRGRIVFAFHDGQDVPPHVLRLMLTREAGLADPEIAQLLNWP